MKAGRIAILAVATVALGTLVFQVRAVRRGDATLAQLKTDLNRAETDARFARRDRDDAPAASRSAQPGNVSAETPVAPPAAASLSERWLGKARALRDLIARNPDRWIPEMNLLTDEEFLVLAQTLKIDTDENARMALKTLRDRAKGKMVVPFQEALRDFAAAHGDAVPASAAELAPYLNIPLGAEIAKRYDIVRSGLLSQIPYDSWILAEKVPADDTYDLRLLVASFGSGMWTVTPDAYLTTRAISGYMAANNGRKPTNSMELVPFLDRPLDSNQLQTRFQAWQDHPDTLGLRMQSMQMRNPKQQ